MLIITEDNDPLIINNNRQGYMIDTHGSCHVFDNIQYFEENAEWPEAEGPFYYLTFNSEISGQPFSMGIEVSNVQFIKFDRIRGLEGN